MPVDLATLLGFLIGLLLILAAMALGSGLAPFFNVPGLLIVVGGATCATLMRFPLKECFKAFATAAKKAFRYSESDPNRLIEEVKDLAEKARKNGMLALEDAQIDNPMLAKGIGYCVDGYDPEMIERILEKKIAASITNNQTGEKIFRAMGDAAPAFGMIGTLVGLVQMLGELNDPSGIGPAMAIAMLTTLYGAMLANMFFLPIADKLAMRAEQEAGNKELILESVIGIREGISPRILEQSLSARVEPEENTQQAPA